MRCFPNFAWHPVEEHFCRPQHNAGEISRAHKKHTHSLQKITWKPHSLHKLVAFIGGFSLFKKGLTSLGPMLAVLMGLQVSFGPGGSFRFY